MDMIISSKQELEAGTNTRATSGQENMIGRAIFRGLEMLCPVSTSSAVAIAEQPELRAYKLGKQKCSYNQVELVIMDVGPEKASELKVSEAIETCVGAEVDEQLRESCLKFNVRFVNNNRMHLYIYAVYATPYGTSRIDKHPVMYHWIPVTRSKCRKGCKGAVIRGLQRFGRMPRRSAATLDGEDSWKEPRHLYIAIDEASTHVCARHETSKFRLLLAAYDDKNQLLGTTVSTSIRVLANNDAPLGAASFKLHCHIKGGWGSSVVANSPLQSISHTFEQPEFMRSPLQDIMQNSSPPRSYKSTITDETARDVDIASKAGPLLELEHHIMPNEKILADRDLLSGGKRQFGAADEAVVLQKADKEHSLTDLCQRLFETCVAKQELGHATITLRGLANALGARRRRILEILNVLESIQVVQHQGKERYTWIGSSQITRALAKLKGSTPTTTGQELADTSRSSRMPVRKAKLKTALPRQIEDMRTEANNPMRALSKRFIQLFMVQERDCPVPWEKILECIVDGQGHDPETMRAKTRRLGEIARIFSALHLIKKVVSQRIQSGAVYEWLGTQGVADFLVSINFACPDGRSRSTHQAKLRVNSPFMEGKRSRGNVCDRGSRLDDANKYSQDLKETSVPANHLKHNYSGGKSSAQPVRKGKKKYAHADENTPFTGSLNKSQQQTCPRPNKQPNQPSRLGSVRNDYLGASGGYALSAAYRLCRSTLAGHIRGEISSQLEASVSHQMSQLPTWRTQAPLKTVSKTLPQEGHPSSTQARQKSEEDLSPSSAFELDRDSSDLEILNSPTASERVDEGAASLDRTDKGSITTGQLKEARVTYKQTRRETVKEADLTKIVGGRLKVPNLAGLESEDPDHSKTANYCDSTLVLDEKEGTVEPTEQILRSQGHVMEISGCNASCAAHQFPYKKRKFDIASFTSFGESNECAHSRNSQSSPLSNHDELHPQIHQENRPSTFDPLFHLLCFNSPKRIVQLQSQNPAFLFTYVKESRALYHKWCSQNAGQNLIRPVASVGKVLTVQSIPGVRATISPSISAHFSPICSFKQVDDI